MKLSIGKFRLGCSVVFGGRLLRVATAHAISLLGRESKSRKDKPLEGHVYCDVGDFALEVLTRNGSVLGHSYLTGPAIGLMRYTSAGPGWFDKEPAKLVDVTTLRMPGHGDNEGDESAQAYARETIAASMALKYGGQADIFMLRIQIKGAVEPDVGRQIVGHFLECWRSTPPDDENGEGAHLLILVKLKTSVGAAHWQPRRHASEHDMTDFQYALAWNALDRAEAAVAAAKEGGRP